MTGGPVFVSGAAGRTGQAVIAALIRHGRTVHGLVRSQEKAATIEALGATAVLGDLDDTDSLVTAAAGCAVFIHIGPPMHPNEVEQTCAMLDAAKAVGARDFIYYSVMHPIRQDVEHHRLKLLAEAHVVGSGLDYTILQPCRYMQHLEGIWDQVVAKGEHAMPFDTALGFSVVDLADLAEAVALVTINSGHRFATYELAGPQPLSQQDMAAMLARRLGRDVTAIRVAPEMQAERMTASGIPAERVSRALKMNRHYDHHGFRGNANVLRWLLGREPGSFAAYVDRLAASRGIAA